MSPKMDSKNVVRVNIFWAYEHPGGGGPSSSNQPPIEYDLNLELNVQTIIKEVHGRFKSNVSLDMLCMRVLDTEHLVGEKDMRSLIQNGTNLKIVAAPKVMAANMIKQLDSDDEFAVKRTLFQLQKLLKESTFMDEFISRDGLERLQEWIIASQGNALAYALTSLLSLMEHNHGWDNFDLKFISTLVSIIVKQNMVNICRPATAIIIKLVISDSTSNTSRVHSYGFDIVHEAILLQSAFLPTLIQRLKGTEYLLQLNSMNLINALLRHATPPFKTEFYNTLDSLGIRKVVIHLMQLSPTEEFRKLLLEFQKLIVMEANRRKKLTVMSKTTDHLLEQLWSASGLVERPGYKWTQLGFETEFPKRELAQVGLLGVELIHIYAVKNHSEYRTYLPYSHSAPSCPFARMAIEVADIIGGICDLGTGYTTASKCQPLMLMFEEMFAVLIDIFHQFWDSAIANSSGSEEAGSVMLRVSSFVRVHFRKVIQNIDSPASSDVFKRFVDEMQSVQYSEVKERYLIDDEQDLMSRAPVSMLRERLDKESQLLVKQQRINCMIRGGWFHNVKDKGLMSSATNPYRFYVLAPHMRDLYYGDFPNNGVRPEWHQLPEKVNLTQSWTLATGASSPAFSSRKLSTVDPKRCFSLVSAVDDSQPPVDFVCMTDVQIGEWTDGLKVIMNHLIMEFKETNEYIKILTEVGVKIALLDITGEDINIPASGVPAVPEYPQSWGFYYDEGLPEEGIDPGSSIISASELSLGPGIINPPTNDQEDDFDEEWWNEPDLYGRDELLINDYHIGLGGTLPRRSKSPVASHARSKSPASVGYGADSFLGRTLSIERRSGSSILKGPLMGRSSSPRPSVHRREGSFGGMVGATNLFSLASPGGSFHYGLHSASSPSLNIPDRVDSVIPGDSPARPSPQPSPGVMNLLSQTGFYGSN